MILRVCTFVWTDRCGTDMKKYQLSGRFSLKKSLVFLLSVCLSPHLHLNHPLFTETQSLNPSMHFFTKESRVSRSQDKIRERHFLSRCDILRLYRIYLTIVTYTAGERSKKEERQLLIRTKNWCSMFCVRRETLHCCLTSVLDTAEWDHYVTSPQSFTKYCITYTCLPPQRLRISANISWCFWPRVMSQQLPE